MILFMILNVMVISDRSKIGSVLQISHELQQNFNHNISLKRSFFGQKISLVIVSRLLEHVEMRAIAYSFFESAKKSDA